MTESPHNPLVEAYRQMMERLHQRLAELEQAEQAAFPQLSASIEHVAEKAVELGELTREEARLIGSYLHRDLEDAGRYLTTTGRDLSAWLRFDLELLEERLLDFLQRGADQSRQDGLIVPLSPDSEPVRYQCGEVTGPGTLYCEACGELSISHAPTTIKPCTACGGTVFLRVSEE